MDVHIKQIIPLIVKNTIYFSSLSTIFFYGCTNIHTYARIDEEKKSKKEIIRGREKLYSLLPITQQHP
jgi:hypothetical protein